MAHIEYNVSIGIIGILLRAPIVALARWLALSSTSPMAC